MNKKLKEQYELTYNYNKRKSEELDKEDIEFNKKQMEIIEELRQFSIELKNLIKEIEFKIGCFD